MSFRAPRKPARNNPQQALRPLAFMRVENEARALLVTFLAIFAAGTLGLATRHAFSVSFWPANAVLVGLMLRVPGVYGPAGWAGALAGFLTADVAFGRDFQLAGMFAGTNMLGSFTATILLRRLDERDLQLRQVHSVLRILVCLIPGCLVAGVGGAVLVAVEFGGSALQTLMTWPASDLVNYLVILPAMLTVKLRWPLFKNTPASPEDRWKPGPAFFLVISCIVAVSFDGPGNIVFPLPALLLCALTYSIPTTALLTMFTGIGCLIALGLDIINIGQDMAVPRMVVSMRFAVAFLVLAPLTISSAMAVRDQLLEQLRDAADHDGLTGLLNRRAFEQAMLTRLKAVRKPGRSLLVLWLDIDHFKAINDRHGHLAGDIVLQAFAETARTCCRKNDLVGRLGGEEFALVAEVSDADAAKAVAERVRQAFAAQTIVWNGEPIQATASIGACHLAGEAEDVPELVKRLDEALYRAKRKGRDRIEWFNPDADTLPPPGAEAGAGPETNLAPSPHPSSGPATGPSLT